MPLSDPRGQPAAAGHGEKHEAITGERQLPAPLPFLTWLRPPCRQTAPNFAPQASWILIIYDGSNVTRGRRGALRGRLVWRDSSIGSPRPNGVSLIVAVLPAIRISSSFTGRLRVPLF